MNCRAWSVLVLICLLGSCAEASSSSSSSSAPSWNTSSSSSSSSAASFSSSSAAPVTPYWDYIQSETITMPSSEYGYQQIAASRDPSQPDRLFYITQSARFLYSIDLATGEAYPTWYPDIPCGFNATSIIWFVPLSNSIMLYSRTNQSGVAVMLRVNHTSFECLQAWPFNVTYNSGDSVSFAVDETNQRFVLFTQSSDKGTLSMISMVTGAMLANNSNYYMDWLSFDIYSGDYLCGPNMRAIGNYKSYNQINSNDLSLVRNFQPFSNWWFRTMFYDQTGSIIGIGDYFAYVTPVGVAKQFSSNIAGVAIDFAITLNHDVIGLYLNDGYTGYTAARFIQYHPSQSSTVDIERSLESSSRMISAFFVGSACLVVIGVLIGLSLWYRKRQSAESKSRYQSLGEVILVSN